MVVFTCGQCGESVKKPAVQKHFGRCGQHILTCVDCFKDFRGNEFESHIKCVTEEERYAAKGFVAKPSSNKGEKKQQSWFEAVQSVLNSDRKLMKDERELLTVLGNHENLPRKKAKFINFLNSAHRAYARKQDLVERVWSIIEEVGKAATANSSASSANEDHNFAEKKQNEESTAEGEKRKKKKMNGNSSANCETAEGAKDDTTTEKKRKNLESTDEKEERKKRKMNGENLENGKATDAENTDDLSDEDLQAILKQTNISLYALLKLVGGLSTAQSPKALKKIQKKIIVNSLSLK